MKKMAAGLSLIVAAACGVVAALPSPVIGFTTTTGTTVQPATADTVIVGLGSGNLGLCGTSQTESFSSGSGINFTVKLNVKPGGYVNSGCRASFNMKS